MKLSLITLLSALAAMATAEAMPAPGLRPNDVKPKYYFPRAVKRQLQFGNSTSTGVDSTLNQATNALASVATALAGTSSTTDTVTGPVQTTSVDPSVAVVPAIVNTATTSTGTVATGPSTTPTTSGATIVGLSTVITGQSTTTDSSLSAALNSQATSVLSVVSSLASVAATASSGDLASLTTALSSAASVASSIASEVSSANSAASDSTHTGVPTGSISTPTDTPILTPAPVANVTTHEPTPAIVTPTDVTTTPVASVKPSAVDTATTLSPQASILSATSVSESSHAPSTSASAIPTSIPSTIQPQGQTPVAPDNSSLIQLGFTYGLNYNFVVSSSVAAAQIFSYLPVGVTYALGIPESKMVIQYLQPYNTLPALGYITTLAMAYIPSDQVDKLSVQLLNPNSDLYNNPNPSVKALMSMIDPSIPLLAGATNGANGTPINSPNSATATPGDGTPQGGAPGSADTPSTAPVRPSSVGIAVGAVAGAAVYGAAMFLVARRYKKRKAGHQRTSSVLSGGIRRGETSNLMAGARNSYGSRYPQTGRGSRNSDRSDHSSRSGRTYISPPVMAENSLGWN